MEQPSEGCPIVIAENLQPKLSHHIDNFFV